MSLVVSCNQANPTHAMNTHRILAIIITAFFVAASAPCPASDNEGGRSIAIELKDGSRIVGKSLDNAWQFHSAALGDLNPNLAGIQCSTWCIYEWNNP